MVDFINIRKSAFISGTEISTNYFKLAMACRTKLFYIIIIDLMNSY